MANHLVLVALGPHRADSLPGLACAVRDSGCRIVDSRATLLGSEFAAMLLVTGNWNAIVKLEDSLPRLQEQLELAIHARRTAPRPPADALMPYAVEVVAAARPGVVCDIAEFFAARDIGIEDVSTSGYPAPHTGTPMFSLHMTVAVPTDTSIAALRGEFMDFCDHLNLDAIMEPVK